MSNMATRDCHALGGFLDDKGCEFATRRHPFRHAREVFSPQPFSLDVHDVSRWIPQVVGPNATYRFPTTRSDVSNPATRTQISGRHTMDNITRARRVTATPHSLPGKRLWGRYQPDNWFWSSREWTEQSPRRSISRRPRIATCRQPPSHITQTRCDKHIESRGTILYARKHKDKQYHVKIPHGRGILVSTTRRRIRRRTIGRLPKQRNHMCGMACPRRASRRKRKRPVFQSQSHGAKFRSRPLGFFDFSNTLSDALYSKHDGAMTFRLLPHVGMSNIDNLNSGISQTDSYSFCQSGCPELWKAGSQNITSFGNIWVEYVGTQMGGGSDIGERTPTGDHLLTSDGGQASVERPRSPKRKCREGDDLDNGDGDREDSSRKRPRHGDAEIPRKKFACPYFKHNPRKYAGVRSCLGPGWPTAHRVKEHLLRKHTLHLCERCYSDFETEDKLRAHVQQPISCAPGDKPAPEGINKSQEIQLRKRGKKAQTDEERWKEMYQILFPAERYIPSPYYDPEEAKPDIPSDQQIVQQDVLEAVQSQVRNVVSDLAADQARRIVASVTDVVQGVLRRVFRSSLNARTRALEPLRRSTGPVDSQRAPSSSEPQRRFTEPTPGELELGSEVEFQQPLGQPLPFSPDSNVQFQGNADFGDLNQLLSFLSDPESFEEPQTSNGEVEEDRQPSEYRIDLQYRGQDISQAGELVAEDQATIVPARDIDSSESTTEGPTPTDSSNHSTSQRDVEPSFEVFSQLERPMAGNSQLDRDLAFIGGSAAMSIQHYELPLHRISVVTTQDDQISRRDHAVNSRRQNIQPFTQHEVSPEPENTQGDIENKAHNTF